MANFIGLDKGYKTGGNVAMFRGVVLSADDTVMQSTVLGSTIVGVVQETVDATDISGGKRIVNVRMQGITKAICSAAIARGAKIAVAADGRFLTAVATNNVVGFALTSTAAAGDQFDMEIAKGGLA